MWAIWVKYMLPAALNVCPKCKKSPNLVTLSSFNLVIRRYLKVVMKIALISTSRAAEKETSKNSINYLLAASILGNRHLLLTHTQDLS